MTPIAAYYVMIVTDNDHAARKPARHASMPRRSLLERFGEALETLFSLGRPSSTRPI